MTVAEGTRRLVSEPVEAPEPYTASQLADMALAYPELRIELTKEGELVIMAPTKVKTGNRNVKLSARLENWAEQTDSGETFDSSTLFTMPSGALRSPDACWIERSRYEAFTEEELEEFTLICPDFVAELRSSSDRLSAVQKKMREYMDNGAKLGWLIDPISRRVEIYRPGQDVEILNNPTLLSGEPVLPGFTLDLKGILQ